MDINKNDNLPARLGGHESVFTNIKIFTGMECIFYRLSMKKILQRNYRNMRRTG